MAHGGRNNIQFYCDKCEYITYSQKSFEDHYENHKNEVVHLCRKCGHVIVSLQELVHHIKKDCTGFKDIILHCGMRPCGYNSNDPFEFISHLKYAHRGVSLVPCFHCNKCFTFPIFLVQHMQIGCCERIEQSPPQEDVKNNIKSNKKSAKGNKKRKTKIVYLPVLSVKTSQIKVNATSNRKSMGLRVPNSSCVKKSKINVAELVGSDRKLRPRKFDTLRTPSEKVQCQTKKVVNSKRKRPEESSDCSKRSKVCSHRENGQVKKVLSPRKLSPNKMYKLKENISEFKYSKRHSLRNKGIVKPET